MYCTVLVSCTTNLKKQIVSWGKSLLRVKSRIMFCKCVANYVVILDSSLVFVMFMFLHLVSFVSCFYGIFANWLIIFEAIVVIKRLIDWMTGCTHHTLLNLLWPFCVYGTGTTVRSVINLIKSKNMKQEECLLIICHIPTACYDYVF